MSRIDPIDDSEEIEITKEQVVDRIADWLQRLNELFSSIKSWAEENNWSVDDQTQIPMHEDLMRRFQIPETRQPCLSLHSPDGQNVWIKPKGLWVIGANGRVDIFSPKGAFVLVDVAEHFQPPEWVLHHIGKGSGQPFDPSHLATII